jgi:hypothetical protein
MGLLDDAIREHLDLKRRRGADPTEVERAEREALGPVRRGPEEPLVATHEEEPPAAYEELPAEYEDAEDDGWDELTSEHAPAVAAPVEYEDEYEDEEEEYDEPAAAAAPVEHAPPPARSAPGELIFTSEREELHDEPLPHAAPPEPGVHVPADEPAHPGEPAHPEGFGETVEYDVERALDAEDEAPAAEEDPLEETPEFLQDTPDHDRLWFEQRPPRDFDFDG